MYSKITHQIRVTVQPQYLDQQSRPDENHYVWAYSIEISNEGAGDVQLLNRHWIITDGRGQVQEVKGPGVVGEQPVLHPGDSFTYTSGCPLATPSGIMVGRYEMETPDGERFWVDVPAFSLDSPYQGIVLN